MFGAATQRPDIRPKRATIDWLCEFAAIVGVVLSIILVVVSIGDLPARIPTHFNSAGQPNSWGPRATLWLLPAVTVVMWALMSVVQLIPPRMYNYPWTITEDNAAAQYRYARRLIAVIKLECVWIFTWLTAEIIDAAERAVAGQSGALNPAFLPTMLGVLFLTIVVYFVLAFRAR